MTRPIFMAKANVTSKLAFGRTQDVATLHTLAYRHASNMSGGQQNGKGESAHGRDSLLHYLMSYTTRHLMTLKHYKGAYGVVK